MNNYKIEISYDGSLFHGFQKQLNVRTVQSEIEDSLKLITQNYELNYAGRTDAGVHARSQIISLKTIDNLEPSFFNSLDSLLGDEIKIKKFQKVKNSFHPRFNAKSRVYKYFLQPNDKGTPYNRNYRYLVKTPLGVTIPGVEVHANVIENILDQSYLIRNPNIYVFELLFSIILVCITFVLSQKISALRHMVFA